MERVIKELSRAIKDESAIRVAEPMSRHTTFGVGGPADIFIDMAADEIEDVIGILREGGCPFTIIGNGSDLLVSDEGLRGAVLCIGRRMAGMEMRKSESGAMIDAFAGALLPTVARKACDEGLKGLEFATQIPGTVGGAVYMNAGAFGGDMSDTVLTVTAVDMDGRRKLYKAEDLGFGYRKSIFAERKEVIVSAMLALSSGNPEEIRERVSYISSQRAASQPVGKRSAGSTFRKVSDGDTPETMTPAWKLVQQAGMKDARVGAARVSPKHSGFVINEGGASATEIYTLINQIIEKVKDETGVALEPEVKILGKF